ncbi:hypothetical protein CI610_00905 [invertebrate metagenome]|uniref:RING-type domain-containing protein n=1 Tax=invertebrate metagenome TaxID=1711999 RepID=A0A2H9TA73_9ZZZZ
MYSVAQGAFSVKERQTIDDAAVLSDLPKCSVATSSTETECSICSNHKININLFCGHGFCAHCIKEWIEQSGHDHSAFCPTCRTKIDIAKISPRYD